MRRPALPFSVVAVVALGPALALGAPASAAPVAADVVISEVYGGGGNSGAAWRNDYVELYNPTDQAVDLTDTSVQYRSATGTVNPSGVVALAGAVPAKGYYLVSLASGGAVGEPLPAADASSSGVNLSATSGTVFLAAQSTALSAPPTGSITGDPAILDLVGFGTSNTFETKAAPAPSSTTSIARDAAGKDTDDNSADLVVGAGTPDKPPADGGPVEPPPAPVARTIAEIQGTGSASPVAGQTVVTTGVVTAAYASGGFNGFYVQTAGTGGDLAEGHQASDGVFVFGSAAAAAVRTGDHVEVTGKVVEFNGLTEITPASASDVKVLAEPAAPVRPANVVLPRTTEDREALEGMLVAPQGRYTVADNYTLNQYAEIGLAAGGRPLWTPTEVADPADAAAIQAVLDENAARKVVLDDGSSMNFFTTSKNVPLPYLTQERQIRVGAPVTFTQPVVLDWRNNAWKFQPTGQLTASGLPPATFGHTRTAAPAATGGNVHVSSFNVLNYFPTTGADFVASGGSCGWYDDRAGEHVTVNSCSGPGGELGPRGAADETDFARQQAKIVRAINSLGSDVVSLEEVENSALFGKARDTAVGMLVDALNAEAGPGTWDFVPSPPSADDQTGEDVIRTAFIYRTAAVEPIGDSVIDDVAVFDVARDPLAQAFEPVGGGKYSRFAVIVNHFKSKSSGPDDGTGQGKSNPQRVAQAEELVAFANRMKGALGTEKVFLAGDFNAYTQEDPMRVLYRAGYTDIGHAKSPEEHTYLFDGTVGSLDHVLGNGAAMRTVTGAHVWNINAVESVALEYSRHNYNATDFYEAGPYRSSDHDPLVVGLDLPLGPVATTASATVAPDPVEFREDQPVVRVEIGSEHGVIDGGTVEVREYGVLVGEATVQDGVATITLPSSVRKGQHTLAVSYLGTDDAAASQTTATFTVVKTKG